MSDWILPFAAITSVSLATCLSAGCTSERPPVDPDVDTLEAVDSPGGNLHPPLEYEELLSDSVGTRHTVPPDESALRRAQSEISTDGFLFVTNEVVDALSYGLVGDGRTDNTQIFRALLAGGNKTIRIPPGDYVTDKLSVWSNTVLILEPGVTVRDAGRLGKYDRLLNITTENVHIVGYGARVLSERADYQTDEWRHGVLIFGARRVLIEGLESSSHGGDGFYIGGPAGRPSTDVILKGCAARNNRRQGLSITSGRRIRVVDCEFSATNGTAPEFGVDLEPNNPEDFIDDIILFRVHTIRNRGGGIMIHLEKLSGVSAPPDITIIEHSSADEAVMLRTMVPDSVSATIRYSASD